MTSLYPQHASLPLAELPSTEIEQPSPLFYGGPDDESFHATSPEEYLADLFGAEHYAALEDAVRTRGDVEIVAYRRREVEPEYVRWFADSAWERFVEEFEEEFGGDDSCFQPNPGGKPADAEARDLLAPIFERLARKHLVVWQCEEVSRRTWTVDEVRAALGFASTSSAPPASPAPAAVPVHRCEPKGGA